MKGPGGYGGRIKTHADWEAWANPKERKRKAKVEAEVIETPVIAEDTHKDDRAVLWGRMDLAGDPEQDKAIQLLLKNLSGEQGAWLTVECGGGWVQEALAKQGAKVLSINSWRQDHESSKDKSRGRWENNPCGESDLPEGLWDRIVLRQQRSQERNISWISTLLPRLKPQGELWIVGANDDGIKGFQHKLERFELEVEVRDIGKGSRLLVLTPSSQSIPMPEATPRTWLGFSVQTLPGVFATGQIDEATGILLKHLPAMKNLKVVDLGCGAGVLSAAALKGGASEVHAVDAYLPAVRTARQLNHPQLKVDWDFMGRTCLRGDADIVLTNPPFHQEHRTAQEIPKRWLSACFRAIKPGGSVYLVAHHHLNYTHLAELEGWVDVKEIAKQGPFRLIRMVRLNLDE
jgi:16S rRNA (guanine1207-N2)-methyltransferase